MAKRTTHRRKTGKKLYAVRDPKGRFKNIVTFKRARMMGMMVRNATRKTGGTKT